MSESYCPNCEWGPLEKGELRDGDAGFQWEYCQDCDWQGEITRYQIVHYDWGTAYKIDVNFVRPDLALFRTLKGRLQLTSQATGALATDSSGAQPDLTAPCPQCGLTIRLDHTMAEDLSAYRVSWFCPGCGFHSESTNIQAPGIFRHSEGYKWISWRGTDYELTTHQSVIIKTLHAYWLNGTPDLHQRKLMQELQVPNSRLRDSFRRTNRELFGTLIVHKRGAPRGTLRLNL
jgi:hypothetical protein